MALDLPDLPPPPRDGPHPAVSLMLGFGVIVHVVMVQATQFQRSTGVPLRAHNQPVVGKPHSGLYQ